MSVRSFAICIMFICFGLVLGASASRAEPTLAHSDLVLNNLEDYLIQGEWLAAVSESTSDDQFASQVLAVGIGLAHRRGEFELGASMCIALAAIEQSPEMSSLLWDYALILDSSRKAAWSAHRNARQRSLMSARQDAARCMAAVRMGDVKLAQELYKKDEVESIIRSTAAQLQMDPDDINLQISRAMNASTHDDCKGRVFLVERGQGEMRRVVCPDHARSLGAGESEHQLKIFMALEMNLLGDRLVTSWGASAYLEMSRPVFDPSSAFIAQHYQVDLSKPIWSNNTWVADP